MGVVYKRKDSPFYWIAYGKGKNRRRESSGAKTQSLAKEILRQRETEALRKGHFAPVREVEIGSYIKEYLKWVGANLRPHTIRSYSTILRTFMKYIDDKEDVRYLEDVDLKFLEDYKQKRLSEVKTKTVNNNIINLKAFFNKACEWNYIVKNPAKKLKTVEVTDAKKIRILTETEYKCFMKTCKNEYPYFYPIFYVFCHTGLRKAELENLEWDDIDFRNGYLQVTSKDGFRPKGIDRRSGKAKERIIPMHDGLIKVLKGVPRVNAKVFKTYDKLRLRRVLIRVAKKAGIKDFTRLHEMRHTYASVLAQKGVDIYKIKELLGHSDIKQTMKYAHLPAAYMKDDVKVLQELDEE